MRAAARDHRLIVGILAVIVAACAGGPPTPGPSQTASGGAAASGEPMSSAGASVGPTSTPESTPAVATSAPSSVRISGPYVPSTGVRVIVDGLRIREEPSTEAGILAGLDSGDVLVLGSLPRLIDGRVWYFASRVAEDGEMPDRLPPEEDRPQGWVAVRDGETDYVEPLPPRPCPGVVSLETVTELLGTERLACFGGSSIALKGVYGCGGCGGFTPGEFSPRWLTHPFVAEQLSVDPPADWAHVILRIRPDGPDKPEQASIVRVVGHFDDPASERCELSVSVDGTEALVRVPERFAVAVCRDEFVLESYEVLGTDPDFPLG